MTVIRSCTSSVRIFLSKGLLEKNTIVTTVMSNLGFHKALDAKGIQKEITAVGDRYVVEEMRKSGYNLGGEQSGHVIVMDYNTTGDGQMSRRSIDQDHARNWSSTLSELGMQKLPSILKNWSISVLKIA